LGTRARVRQICGELEPGHLATLARSLRADGRHHGDPKSRSASTHVIRTRTANASPSVECPARPRRLQQDGSGGVGVETAALVLTGVLGVLSFLVQARASAAADRRQKDTEAARSVTETQRQERV
jgi:hypothetical protein